MYYNELQIAKWTYLNVVQISLSEQIQTEPCSPGEKSSDSSFLPRMFINTGLDQMREYSYE